MNRDILLKIKENTRIAPKTMKMVLEGDTCLITNPGQFVNLQLKGKYLRRPISVGEFESAEKGMLTLFYDIVGEGTAQMAEMKEGEQIQTLMGLGNGFDLDVESRFPALMGGGIGVAPLLGLGKELIAHGKKPIAFIGFNTKEDVVLERELIEAGIETVVCTVDGSYGFKGFVTDGFKNFEISNPDKIDYFYACGPMPMLKALSLGMKIPGELSLDERMACGFGVCMCCSVMTNDGAKRICKDGPVFKKEELTWK